MGQEIELKLEVAPEALDALAQEPWLRRHECPTRQQVSIYFDTPRHLLRKRGYTLRVRQVGGRYIQTVKSLDGGAGLFERGEWEYEIGGPTPDAEALSRTPLADIELDHLQPILKSDISRTVCVLHDEGSEVELDIDTGSMSANDRDVPISEIEIELRRGSPEAALKFARRISRHVPVKLGVLSKAERGFALADGTLGRVRKADAVPVSHGMTVAEGFAAIVASCVRHFRLNEQLVVEQRVPEALHQARVAMRRLRSAFTLFRTAISDHEYVRIREELRWFTAELGEARNLDVYLQRQLPENERRELKERRERAYDHVVAAMDSERCRHLMLDLVGWTALGPWRQHAAAAMPLEPYVNRRIDKLWERISDARHLDDMEDEERHRLRILIKKLRYALEFVAVLHRHERESQKSFGKAVEELQEALGHLNDYVVARTLVTADAWPIAPDEPSEDERKLLREADEALEQLRTVGRYWRAKDN